MKDRLTDPMVVSQFMLKTFNIIYTRRYDLELPDIEYIRIEK